MAGAAFHAHAWWAEGFAVGAILEFLLAYVVIETGALPQEVHLLTADALGDILDDDARRADVDRNVAVEKILAVKLNEIVSIHYANAISASGESTIWGVLLLGVSIGLLVLSV